MLQVELLSAGGGGHCVHTECSARPLLKEGQTCDIHNISQAKVGT